MTTVSVQIGGKAFSTNCPEGEEAALNQATQQIEASFTEIRRHASNFPFEQTLVLAALNIIVGQQRTLKDIEDRHQHLEERLQTIVRLFSQVNKDEDDANHEKPDTLPQAENL